MLVERYIDWYQRRLYRVGAIWHGFYTGQWSTLDYHNKFTRMAERSIEKQGHRPSGRAFLNKYGS
jgi:hypothetical protein